VSVAICGRGLAKFDATRFLFESAGIGCWMRAMTIRDPVAVCTLLREVAAKCSRLDVLANNAKGQFPQAAIDFRNV